jgi:DNA-binding transcriptional ArsR family regulator
MNILRIFQVLAVPTRFAIFRTLGAEGMTVSAVADAVGISTATASRHLSELRRVRLVEEHWRGREHRYRWPRDRRLVIGFEQLEAPSSAVPKLAS